jgi:hypothetical protein
MKQKSYRTVWAALGCVAFTLLAPGVVRADMWTNVAGRAVEAVLVSVDHNVAVFKSPDGTRFEMALASLAPASRQLAVDKSGRVEVPERLQTDYNLYVRTIQRLDALRSADKLKEDEYSKQRETALAQFEKACVKMNITVADRSKLLLAAGNR